MLLFLDATRTPHCHALPAFTATRPLNASFCLHCLPKGSYEDAIVALDTSGLQNMALGRPIR